MNKDARTRYFRSQERGTLDAETYSPVPIQRSNWTGEGCRIDTIRYNHAGREIGRYSEINDSHCGWVNRQINHELEKKKGQHGYKTFEIPQTPKTLEMLRSFTNPQNDGHSKEYNSFSESEDEEDEEDGRNYEGRNYEGRNYEGRNYEGRNYEGRNYGSRY